jgi:2,3-bisphosphoglycerate-independent phosphoglycerate mutase
MGVEEGAHNIKDGTEGGVDYDNLSVLGDMVGEEYGRIDAMGEGVSINDWYTLVHTWYMYAFVQVGV